MADCEICGSMAEKKAEIDGVILNVCGKCAELGKVVAEPVRALKTESKETEDKRYVDPGYPEIIKRAREKRGLKIGEIARRINEKESVISHLETGHLSPTLGLARKLEDFLGVKLILEQEENSFSGGRIDRGRVTIGDVAELGGLDD